MPKEVPHSIDDSEKRETFLVASAYDPKTTSILLSTDNESVFTREVNDKLQTAFYVAKRLDLFEEFRLVLGAAEEYTHFVQHTRGEIPFATQPAIPAMENRLQISEIGLTLSPRSIQSIKEVVKRVKELTEYHGHPPQSITVSSTKFLITGTDTNTNHLEYLTLGMQGRHHKQYPFEAYAERIRNHAVSLWLTDHGLPFSIET